MQTIHCVVLLITAGRKDLLRAFSQNTMENYSFLSPAQRLRICIPPDGWRDINWIWIWDRNRNRNQNRIRIWIIRTAVDKNVQLLPSASFLLTRASESSQGKVKEPQSLNRDGKRKVGITPRARANVDSSPKAGRRILSEAGERVSTRNSLRWVVCVYAKRG